MSDYDYLNARIKGISSHLFTEEFYSQVLAVEGADAVIDSLLSSPYGPAMRESLAVKHGLPGTELALRRDLFETLDRIRAWAPEEPLRLLSIQFCYWDIENIITIMRGKTTAVPDNDILAALFPAGTLDDVKLTELVREPDITAVADTLVAWSFPFAFELRKILRDHDASSELEAVESTFVDGFFCWATGQLSTRDENEAMILSQLQRQIDIKNVMVTLMDVQRKQTGRDDMAPLEWIGHGKLRPDILASMQACRDIYMALEVLASTYFAPGMAKGILAFGGHHRLGEMERFLEMVVIEMGCRMFRADPLGIGVLIGYVWRKLNEFLNLRILLRGKAYARSPVAIREELLIV